MCSHGRSPPAGFGLGPWMSPGAAFAGASFGFGGAPLLSTHIAGKRNITEGGFPTHLESYPLSPHTWASTEPKTNTNLELRRFPQLPPPQANLLVYSPGPLQPIRPTFSTTIDTFMPYCQTYKALALTSICYLEILYEVNTIGYKQGDEQRGTRRDMAIDLARSQKGNGIEGRASAVWEMWK